MTYLYVSKETAFIEKWVCDVVHISGQVELRATRRTADAARWRHRKRRRRSRRSRERLLSRDHRFGFARSQSGARRIIVRQREALQRTSTYWPSNIGLLSWKCDSCLCGFLYTGNCRSRSFVNVWIIPITDIAGTRITSCQDGIQIVCIIKVRCVCRVDGTGNAASRQQLLMFVALLFNIMIIVTEGFPAGGKPVNYRKRDTGMYVNYLIC